MLTNAFLAPERDHATRLVDATAAAVKLAECLVEPWFRARCALGAGYPFQHSDDEGEDEGEGGGRKKRNADEESEAGEGFRLLSAEGKAQTQRR